ncbi:MAG: phenylalanine--tRNA ligase subunit beta [Alphaproteobacteria bacterium]
MKISLNWLRDYLDMPTPVDVPALVRGLVQLGHEVDAVEDAGKAFTSVVVGHIVERVQHPKADRLGVCQVDVGQAHGGVRQIVCGAPNARAGLTVAVALPGAVLPGDFKIGMSKIRDVDSNGMICSVDELGMATARAEGIWEMDTAAPVGTSLAEALGKNDTVLEVAVTPNRGDCLSHLGLARDMAALGLGKLKPLAEYAAGTAACGYTVATEVAECSIIHGVEMNNVKAVPSPAWMQARLEACGVRPRNVLVDATNYVMLAVGQPLHAYDAAKLKGGIVARVSKGGEAFEGINDTKLILNAGDVVIADGEKIVGLGGVLGGSGTAVEDATTHILLEAAVFDRSRIARTGQSHNLSTDARYRFERGVNPVGAEAAIRMAAHLIAEATGGTASVVVKAGNGAPAPKAIVYNPSLCATFGGLEVEKERQKTILETLGFGVKVAGDVWQVTPPAFRTYMANPEDLVEEVLRVVGYENVPATLPRVIGNQLAINGKPVELDRKARKALAAAGMMEAVTYSFIAEADAVQFASASSLLKLDNPLAMDSMTTMRPSLLAGLLRAAHGNAARKDVVAKLGEVGKVFTPQGERLMAAMVLTANGGRTWRGGAVKPDVFTAKAAALQVLELVGAPLESLMVEANAGPAYHPGKSGVFKLGPLVLARFGELHPQVTKHFEAPAALAVVEVELEPLLKINSKTKAWAPSLFPAVKRDVALVVPSAVPASTLQATLRGTNRELITAVELFDVYVGEHVPAGHKSLALGLTLQAQDKTLTEGEITAAVAKAVEAAAAKHGAVLRS